MRECDISTVVVLLASLTLMTAPVFGQSALTTPKTADGQPNLSGVWANNRATPLQRPEQLAGKARAVG